MSTFQYFVEDRLQAMMPEDQTLGVLVCDALPGENIY